MNINPVTRRSREGAWIEIDVRKISSLTAGVAPARERGLKWRKRYAYVERLFVAPARERGLKYEAKLHMHNCFIVAPARERGLKL